MNTGYMGFDLKEQKATILNDGNDPWSTTTLGTVGLAVKNAMRVPEKTVNKYLYIESFAVSQNQVLASFEKATGKKWEVIHVDGEERRKTGLEKMSQGDVFGGAGLLIQYMACVHGNGGDYTKYQERANDLLSLPQESLDAVVGDILKH